MNDLSRNLEGELILGLNEDKSPSLEDDGHRKLLGMLISDRVVMKGNIQRMWNPAKGMKIVDMVNNIMMFKFNYNMEKMKIVKNRPWSFMRHLIALV